MLVVGHSFADPVGERIAFDADLLVGRLRSVSRALLSRQITSSTGNLLVSRELFNSLGDLKTLNIVMIGCLFFRPACSVTLFLKEEDFIFIDCIRQTAFVALGL